MGSSRAGDREGRGSRDGSRRRVALCALGALAAAAALVAGVGTAAGADTALARAKSAVEDGRVAEAKRGALADLAALDTSSAREALEGYADAKDARLASQALLTIGASDSSGARTKLAAVFEDATRPHAARVAAFLALARLRAKDGDSWDDISSYAAKHVKEGSPLAASVAAARNALFPASKGGK